MTRYQLLNASYLLAERVLTRLQVKLSWRVPQLLGIVEDWEPSVACQRAQLPSGNEISTN
jgi:hypothetical protein